MSSSKPSADCPLGVMWMTAHSHVVDPYPMVNGQDRRHEVELCVFAIDGDLLAVMATNFPETTV